MLKSNICLCILGIRKLMVSTRGIVIGTNDSSLKAQIITVHKEKLASQYN